MVTPTRLTDQTGGMVEHPVPVALGRFKDSMAELASGVCLLTVHLDGGDRDLGMTVTSLASASLDPPMVMVGIGRGTSMAPFLQPGARVGLSILSAHQRELAAAFSVKGRPSAADILRGSEHHRGPVTGALLADGALAQLEGLVDQTIAAGDHLLVVVVVLVADAVQGDPSGEQALLYHRRGYTRSEAGGSPVVAPAVAFTPRAAT